MLVLTRKVGDVIAIGDNIKIVVMAIKGKQVRLGVQADRNTVVHREEIYQKIQQEIRAASVSDTTSTKAAGDLLKQSAKSSLDKVEAGNAKAAKNGFTLGKSILRKALQADDKTPDDLPHSAPAGKDE